MKGSFSLSSSIVPNEWAVVRNTWISVDCMTSRLRLQVDIAIFVNSFKQNINYVVHYVDLPIKVGILFVVPVPK